MTVRTFDRHLCIAGNNGLLMLAMRLYEFFQEGLGVKYVIVSCDDVLVWKSLQRMDDLCIRSDVLAKAYLQSVAAQKT